MLQALVVDKAGWKVSRRGSGAVGLGAVVDWG